METELMDEYDLDAFHRRAIRGVSDAKESSLLEYSQAIPNRVLMRVTEWLWSSEIHSEECKIVKPTVMGRKYT